MVLMDPYEEFYYCGYFAILVRYNKTKQKETGMGRYSKSAKIRYMDMSGLLNDAISWYLKEWRNAVENTGEVKVYTKKEIAEYIAKNSNEQGETK